MTTLEERERTRGGFSTERAKAREEYWRQVREARSSPAWELDTPSWSALSNDRVEYTGKAFTASTDASIFHCAPNPVAVSPATLLPNRSTTPDDDSRTALRAAGLSAAQVTAFEKSGGLKPLKPIAEYFGAAALTELVARLRYTVAQLTTPPHDYQNEAEARRILGVTAPERLAPRLLCAIPGHFRQLARRAPNDTEAFALENMGWLMMGSLRDRIHTAVSKNWWIPPAPAWVTPWPSTLPGYSSAVATLVTTSMQIDTTMALGDFRAREQAWRNSLAGRHWRLETGADASRQGAGRPFYTQLVTVPAAVNIATEKARVDRVWADRLRATDAKFPQYSNDATNALHQCANNLLSGTAGLMGTASLGGLEFAGPYPRLHDGKTQRTSVPFLSAVAPSLTAAMTAIHDLGWQDLLFNTAGGFCFRGIKHPPDPAHPRAHHEAARRISDHGYGIAIDLHAFENPQGSTHHCMDPRLVALFETFRFRWGKCFRVTDPHHFEYSGDAAATALVAYNPDDPKRNETQYNYRRFAPARLIVVDKNATIRQGPPGFAATSKKIPQHEWVKPVDSQSDYTNVTGINGGAIGWTKSSNLKPLFLDSKDLQAVALTPSVAIPLNASWAAAKKQIAECYNRIGGLIEAIATNLGIETAVPLGIWFVESNGVAHIVNRAIIRFENHVFFDNWGNANQASFDQHFQFGTRAPATGAGCGKRHLCHKFRAGTTGAFSTFHGNQADEYTTLNFARTLADNEAIQSISIGGPQIMGGHYHRLGYDTPRAMYDAFQAGERPHVLGFFDYLLVFGLIAAATAKRWTEIGSGYNGDGATYGPKLETAYNDARTVLAAKPTP